VNEPERIVGMSNLIANIIHVNGIGTCKGAISIAVKVDGMAG
jgi:hypothetical protein